MSETQEERFLELLIKLLDQAEVFKKEQCSEDDIQLLLREGEDLLKYIYPDNPKKIRHFINNCTEISLSIDPSYTHSGKREYEIAITYIISILTSAKSKISTFGI